MRVFNPTARWGEEIACRYLQKLGYKIIERNFRKGYGEIDIVAKDKDTLVFIEVKTRTSNEFGLPSEAITPWKLKALIRTAQFYKFIHPNLPELMRLDAVFVHLVSGEGSKSIELVRNISGF